MFLSVCGTEKNNHIRQDLTEINRLVETKICSPRMLELGKVGTTAS